MRRVGEFLIALVVLVAAIAGVLVIAVWASVVTGMLR